MTRSPDTDARCAAYVALMERGHTVHEVALHFGVQRNAVHEALLRRGLPTNMKDAVRAYWQRQGATAQAGAEPAAAES